MEVLPMNNVDKIVAAWASCKLAGKEIKDMSLTYKKGQLEKVKVLCQ